MTRSPTTRMGTVRPPPDGRLQPQWTMGGCFSSEYGAPKNSSAQRAFSQIVTRPDGDQSVGMTHVKSLTHLFLRAVGPPSEKGANIVMDSDDTRIARNMIHSLYGIFSPQHRIKFAMGSNGPSSLAATRRRGHVQLIHAHLFAATAQGAVAAKRWPLPPGGVLAGGANRRPRGMPRARSKTWTVGFSVHLFTQNGRNLVVVGLIDAVLGVGPSGNKESTRPRRRGFVLDRIGRPSHLGRRHPR